MDKLLDKHGRQISYLRLAVTDRCNLRCQYCMPEKGIRFSPAKNILNIDEIKITECCERANVTSLFIFGVNWGINYHAIQLDLITALNWKGLPYLSVEKVIK